MVISWLAGTSEFVRLQHHHLIVALPAGLPTAERGRRLMGLEKTLRTHLDPEAEVFLEPAQDLNKLRSRLRGVRV